MNVQVACTLDGDLAWVSDPVDGSRHDTYCLRESGALTSDAAANWTGDKGYVGTGTLTPIKKPVDRDLLDWEKTFNTQINKIRYVIEQAIANFKTWRIMHTDYRQPLATFRHNDRSRRRPTLLPPSRITLLESVTCSLTSPKKRPIKLHVSRGLERAYSR